MVKEKTANKKRTLKDIDNKKHIRIATDELTDATDKLTNSMDATEYKRVVLCWSNFLESVKNYFEEITEYSEEITRRAIYDICEAYLSGVEEYDVSPIKDVINDGRGSNVRKIIDFFSDIDLESDCEEKEKRIKKVWDEIHNRFRSKANKNHDFDAEWILGSLAEFQKHFKTIEENFEKLMDSFQYLRLSSRHRFPQLLKKYVDSEPGLVGDLILKTIKTGQFIYRRSEKDFTSIIEKMYQLGEKEKADKICRAYSKEYKELEIEIDWLQDLQDIYNKYKQVKS